MKKIILFIILISLVGFSQEEKAKVTVDNYLGLLKNFNTTSTVEKLKTISDENLLQLAQEMYYVYQKYPEAAKEIVWNNVDKIRDYDEISYLTLEHIISDRVKTIFGLETYNILESPYILKVKIISKNIWEYPYEWRIDKDVMITALVEYNLSGDRYSIDDTIQFSAAIYNIENWNRFNIGDQYVVPLDYTYDDNLKVQCLITDQKELLVVDNKILDARQRFVGKSEIEWEILKSNYGIAVNRLMKGGGK